MTAKRVDRLQPGERIAYLQAVWTVTRIRPGAQPNTRDVRLRCTDEPHEQIERLLPDDTHIEVME